MQITRAVAAHSHVKRFFMPLEEPAPLVVNENAVGLNAEFHGNIVRSVPVSEFTDLPDCALVVRRREREWLAGMPEHRNLWRQSAAAENLSEEPADQFRLHHRPGAAAFHAQV